MAVTIPFENEFLLVLPLQCWYITNMVDRMTQVAAGMALGRCLESGTIVFTSHALQEMEADQISRAEVHVILRSGTVYRPPEQDIRSGEWKYRVEGRASGREIAAVFKFQTVERAVIITVFEVK